MISKKSRRNWKNLQTFNIFKTKTITNKVRKFGTIRKNGNYVILYYFLNEDRGLESRLDEEKNWKYASVIYSAFDSI